MRRSPELTARPCAAQTTEPPCRRRAADAVNGTSEPRSEARVADRGIEQREQRRDAQLDATCRAAASGDRTRDVCSCPMRLPAHRATTANLQARLPVHRRDGTRFRRGVRRTRDRVGRVVRLRPLAPLPAAVHHQRQHPARRRPRPRQVGPGQDAGLPARRRSASASTSLRPEGGVGRGLARALGHEPLSWAAG